LLGSCFHMDIGGRRFLLSPRVHMDVGGRVMLFQRRIVPRRRRGFLRHGRRRRRRRGAVTCIRCIWTCRRRRLGNLRAATRARSLFRRKRSPEREKTPS
jgi:hypothetical protein